MLKILHTADIQLDASLGFLGTQGDAHRRQLRQTFQNIVTTQVVMRMKRKQFANVKSTVNVIP